MKSEEKVIPYLESQREEFLKKCSLAENISDEEYEEYKTKALELGRLINEIKANTEVDADSSTTFQEKEFPRFLVFYLHIFLLIVFITSAIFMDGLISDLVDFLRIPKGIVSELFHYGYHLLHLGSCLAILINSKRLLVKENDRNL